MYVRTSGYGGQMIKESKKGWVVEGWSRYQGNRTAYKFLIPFDNCKVKAGENLEAEYNEFMDKGEYLLQTYHIRMDNEASIIKIIRKGYIVE